MKTTNPKMKFHIPIVIIASVIFGLFYIGIFGFNTLSGLRAYVGGEGLWAKNQKEACYQLIQYIYTKDHTNYEAFLSTLQIPQGDETARLELEKNDTDNDIVFRGFLDGGNHPDDISNMIVLFKRFKNNEYIRKSIEQWQLGDQLISELLELGETLQRHISSGEVNQAVLKEGLSKIDSLQKQLTIVENEFSFFMGMASRWAVNFLTKIMIVFTILGSIICIMILFFVRDMYSKLQKYSDNLEITVAAERTAKKELAQKRDQLQKALSEIKTLRGIIPICSYCKNIRNDEGIWAQLEQYIDEHSDAKFSHGICPDCVEMHHPELTEEK